jgi:hypothetical protein
LEGHQRLVQVQRLRDALYAKPDFSEEDGLKAAELEMNMPNSTAMKPKVKRERSLIPSAFLLRPKIGWSATSISGKSSKSS